MEPFDFFTLNMWRAFNFTSIIVNYKMEILFIEPINKIEHIYKFESSHHLFIQFKTILYSQIEFYSEISACKEINLIT